MTAPPPRDTLLSIEGLTVSYGAVEAVRGVDLTVQRGEIVTLLGANGAGKSSTLNALVGLAPRKARCITFQGAEIDSLPSEIIVRRGMTLVPEGRRVFATLTVAENLLLGGAKHAARGALAEVKAQMLDLFPILAERLHQKAGSLSGGEQQMLAIGRCLMGRPDVILFDEPSLGLAPTLVQQVIETVRTLSEQGLTCVLVEQNVTVSLKISSTGYVLESGRITLSGRGSELLTDDRVRKAYLGL